MNLASIALLILDVDGVLTDGSVVPGPDREWSKRFCAQDGCAIKLWQRRGGSVALLSGRADRVVEQRAADLQIQWVYTGISDKLKAYESILADGGFADSAVAYVGDDLPDLAPMTRCAFPVAVANAVPSVKRASAYVTRSAGGSGAVAEIVELLLRKQKRWSRDMLTEV